MSATPEPRVIAERAPKRNAKGKVLTLGYKVRLVPLPAERRGAFTDGLLEMAESERKRREAAGVVAVAKAADSEPEIGCPS